MSKRDLADIEAIETVPLVDRPRSENTYAALQASRGAVARSEGANVLPWRGRLLASAYLDLRGLDAGRKRLSNSPDCAAETLMRVATPHSAVFCFDPDQCPQPIIAPVKLRETVDHAHLAQRILSRLRLPTGPLERAGGLS